MRMIAQRRDLRVWVHFDKAAGELIAIANTNQPGVVLCTSNAQRQQLLKHNRYFLTVRRSQRIELQGVFANGQRFFMRRTRNRAIDIGERAAGGFVPRPDFRGLISIVCHSELPSEW